MRFKNVSSVGDLFLAPAGVEVLAGEVVDVTDEIGASLAEQPSLWEPADDAAKKAVKAVTVTDSEGESE